MHVHAPLLCMTQPLIALGKQLTSEASSILPSQSSSSPLQVSAPGVTDATHVPNVPSLWQTIVPLLQALPVPLLGAAVHCLVEPSTQLEPASGWV
jgi:hypothetical protein